MFAPQNMNNPALGTGSNVKLVLRKHAPQLAMCECTECRQQYRTWADQYDTLYCYDNVIGTEEAAKMCRDLVKGINDDRTVIEKQLSIRSKGIEARWSAYTPEERREILCRLDCTIYDKDAPELWLAYKFRDGNYGTLSCRDDKLRLPHLLLYITLEGLEAEPSRLLNLFRNRSFHHPAEFVAFDSRLLNFAWTAGAVKITFNQNCIVLNGPDFGKLVPWDQESVHSRHSIGFPRGHVILDAQNSLLRLLRGAILELCNDVPADAPELIAQPTLSTRTLDGSSIRSRDEPFNPPTNFSLDDLLAVSRARLNLANDHISQLQTDPQYMQRYSKLIMEGNFNPKTVHIICVQDLDFDLWTSRHWSWVVEEMEQLQRLTDASKIPEKSIGQKLAQLEALILALIDTRSRHIQMVTPFRPGFSHLYDIDHNDHKTMGWTLKSTESDAELFLSDPLDHLMANLTVNPDADTAVDKKRIIERLESYLEKAADAERQRVDETLYRKISDLIALHEILIAIGHYRPRPIQSSFDESMKTAEGTAWRYLSSSVLADAYNEKLEAIKRPCKIQEVVSVGALDDLLEAFMQVQLPKERTQSLLTKYDTDQRRALASFWSKYREQHKAKMSKFGIGASDIKRDLEAMSADRNPAHLSAREEDLQELLATATPTIHISKAARVQAQKRGRKGPGQGMVEPSRASITTKVKKQVEFEATPLQNEWGTTTGQQKPIYNAKIKPKTRGEASMLDNGMESLQIEMPEPANGVQGLKQAHYDILYSLFPSRKGGLSMVAWNSFVGAMAKVGFNSQGSGGSAVSFLPTQESKWDGQGRIVIHRPHPVAKLDSVMLRSIVKRMRTWFGWGKDTFQFGE